MERAPDDPGLGDLLILMVNAHRSFRTLRGEVRTWRHTERSHEAFERQRERSGSSSQVMFALGATGEEPQPEPAESEDRLRVWMARPDRLREEWAGSLGGAPIEATLVQVGATWWSLDPHGAQTNNGSAQMQHGGRLQRAVLDPAELLSCRDFEITGRAVHAGRDAIRVMSQLSPRDPFLPEAGWHYGDWPQELLVDAERGVLLRTVSLLDGEPFSISEFVVIAFDEDILDSLFVFEPPPGVELRDARDRFDHMRVMPLHEAARAAPFGVFVVGAVPGDWNMHVHFMREIDNYGWPASVLIHYANDIASVNVNVSQRAVDADGGPPATPDGSEWRIERIESGDLRLWEPAEADHGMPRIAVIDLDGTRIQISSGDLDAEAIARLAAGLVPAPTEPPATP